MKELVVVTRLKDNTDIVGILYATTADGYQLEHPYQLMFQMTTRNVVMVPWCMYSDQTNFEFLKSETRFVVPASDPIAIQYLSILDPDDEYNLESSDFKNMIEGNETQH